MKITEKQSHNKQSERIAWAIPVGTVFRGTIVKSDGPSYFLRSYAQVVDLANPSNDWACMGGSGRSPIVHDYQPVEAELVIHGPAES